MKKQSVLWASLIVTMCVWTVVGQVRTITLNHNYTGAPASMTRATDTHGSLMGEPLPTPTREGFIFNGWFLTQSGGSVTGKNHDRVLVGATGTKFTQNATIYARWSTPSAIQASSMSQIPAAMKENFDWLRNTRHVREPVLFNRNNLVWDQVFHGGGTINWAIRWESDRVVTLAERQAIARMLHEEINKWTRPLIGMPGWPFQEIPVTVVGWAVSRENLIQDRQPNETVWVNSDHRAPLGNIADASFQYMASAPNNISRFNNFNAVNSGSFTYTGGLHARFDMYLWCTRGFGGGAGGDWGSRQSETNAINAAAAGNATAFGNTGIITHEAGHAFGLYDFYGAVGTDRPPATSTGQIFGQGDLRTIMHVGSGATSASLNSYDQWQIRYYWDWIRTQSAASRFHTYTVAVNGTGTGAMGGGINYPAHYPVSISAGTRSGYTFNGWTSSSAGVTFANASSATTTFTMPASNVTVTANWTAGGGTTTTHTVSFNANGGTGTMTVDSVTQGSNYTIKANTFTRTGHTFSGWRTAASGGTSYAAGATINNVTANITLYAQWTPNTYTIAFNANGGTGTMSSDNVTHGNNYTIKANTFTRTGHTFSGWRTAASSGTSYAAGAQITNVTGNITLFAQWTPNTYTISFNANSGTGTMSADSVTHGSSYTIKANTFTRTGYTFLGWRTAASGGTVYAAGATISNVTANITLFARWETEPTTAILSPDRVIPTPGVDPNDNAAVIITAMASEFTAGPNPVAKSSEVVNFYRAGKRVDNVTLTIFDATGNVVNKIRINDDRPDDDQSRRIIGTWDLTDARGRLVSKGAYLVRGVITTSDGKRERVSLTVGVR